jgi:hypothetical protein
VSHDDWESGGVRRSRARRRTRPGWGRWIGVVLLVLAAGFFSFLNAGERVTLNLGVTTFYRISLVGLVFVVFLLGMVAMFLFGIRYDRQIRDALRDRDFRPPPREYQPFEVPPDPPS